VGPFEFSPGHARAPAPHQQFISGTTFGSRKDAEWLIEKVRTIHLQVVGMRRMADLMRPAIQTC
jgi:hypothetical protein